MCINHSLTSLCNYANYLVLVDCTYSKQTQQTDLEKAHCQLSET